ncbi:MAG: ABC transporter ATP-binding protein [Candidimonas sp.]|nr:MAG: ABC transporter ATP-binding protein [Candidimonas sp.]
MGSDALLCVDGVSMAYRARRGEIQALSSLSFAVARGEFVSVIGPSGCGKSTLLKIVAGLVRPSAGEAVLDGRPVTGPRADVGVVFQKPTLLPWKSVLENVLLPARALKLDMAAARKRAAALLDLVDLGKFANNYPGELSGGMQQRVGLARMLVHDPAFLLMDEPFAALDAMTRESLTLELQGIWLGSGKTVLFITHSIPEAVFLSDRVIMMSGRPGRVLKDVAIDLPRPRTLRTMGSAVFGDLCNTLRRDFMQNANHGNDTLPSRKSVGG